MAEAIHRRVQTAAGGMLQTAGGRLVLVQTAGAGVDVERMVLMGDARVEMVRQWCGRECVWRVVNAKVVVMQTEVPA